MLWPTHACTCCLLWTLPRYGWDLGWEQLQAGVRQLELEKRRPNFGNAGAVSNLLATVAQRMEARTAGLPPAQRVGLVPLAVDFVPEEDRDQQDPNHIFGDLVGCGQVGAWQGFACGMVVDHFDSFSPYTPSLDSHLSQCVRNSQ